VTVSGVAARHQLQERSVIGLSGGLPPLPSGLRFRWGAELAVLWVKHGAGLDTVRIPGDRGLADHLHAGMYLRCEIARGF
jgi:hypothetical protein